MFQISGSSSKDLMSREKDMREKGEKGDRRQKEKSDSGPPSTDMQVDNRFFISVAHTNVLCISYKISIYLKYNKILSMNEIFVRTLYKV